MTNEQLAELIQHGGNDELIPVLWKNVSRLLYQKSWRIYNHYESRCKQSGIELEDIYQECYSVLLSAIKAFNSESGLKFITFLEFPFKNMFFNIVGLRTRKNEPLNNYISLEKPLEQSDGGTCSLFDIISDEYSDEFVQQFENLSEAETIRAVVESLPESYKYVIKAYFFDNIKLIDISDVLGVSPERTRQIKYKALNILRTNKIIKNIHEENKLHQHWTNISRFIYSPDYYELIQNLNKELLSYGQRQAKILDAEIQWKKDNMKNFRTVNKMDALN